MVACPPKRTPDVLACLKEQLKKEKDARDIYKEVAEIAKRNKTKVRDGGFLSRFIPGGTEIRKGVISADEVINIGERLMAQEENHARIVEDLIGALTFLMKK